MPSVSSKTGDTLFAVLKDPYTKQGWDRFVERYGPKIYKWCRAKGLQKCDAEDVMQEVLKIFLKCSKDFQYDPAQTFRGWLRTVTTNCLCDLWKKLARHQASGSPHVREVIESEEARSELADQLEKEFDRELYEQAKERVRPDFETETWEIYARIEASLPAEVIADEMEVSIGCVYNAKCKVIARLKKEIQRLENPDERTS